MLESVVAAESAVQKRVDFPATLVFTCAHQHRHASSKQVGFGRNVPMDPRLYVCHQMRLYVCHQIRLLNLQRSSLRLAYLCSLRSHVF